MAFEGRDFAPGRGVPDARGLVIGGGDDALAVGAEGGGTNRFLMSLRVAISRPVAASQMRAVWSSDAVTTRLPSGLKAADVTGSPCPLRTRALAQIWHDPAQHVERLGELRRHRVVRVARPGGERELRRVDRMLFRLDVGERREGDRFVVARDPKRFAALFSRSVS